MKRKRIIIEEKSSWSDYTRQPRRLYHSVSHSPRAASDFEGHRKLLWDMSDPSQTTVDASALSRRALEIFLSWHDAARSGALSQLPHFFEDD